MKVTLISCTPDPERTVASAARLCYSAASIDTVMEKMTEEKTASFVDMLAEIGHASPIEHAYFTFGVEGVSRALLAQLTRHRIASYSVQSQRYVKEQQFEYVLAPLGNIVLGVVIPVVLFVLDRKKVDDKGGTSCGAADRKRQM